MTAGSILSRRKWLQGTALLAAGLAFDRKAFAQPSFSQWVASFRPRALARGISGQTYDRIMNGLQPDTAVYALNRSQPEFNEQLWQYLNRRASDFRIRTGRERAKEYSSLLARIERDYGVDRTVILALWGMESSFGDVIDNPKYMRPVIPALAALAWGEPRRRAYWEAELLNALTIIERGWGKPGEMIGSWAGAMGHTQWMPEVWLHVGVDYNGDGRISPFGKPDDALAGTARFLVQRGRYRRGESWGCEVKMPGGSTAVKPGAARSYAKWQDGGVVRADGKPFARPNDHVQLWIPVTHGPAFLIGQNFNAIKSYNPALSYTLATAYLADRIGGAAPFVQPFPGGERTPTLSEVQEIQKRLTAAGFNTDGTDGRVGRDTMRAVRAFQKKVGLEPADGYAGLKVLARLRQMP